MKAASAAVLTAAVSVLLKRHNPESALLLGSAAALGILIAALGILNGFLEFRKLVRQSFGSGAELFFSPVLKCLGISIVTRFASDTCKDASQTAAASAVEFAGAVCSVRVVLPLLQSVLSTVGGIR